MHPTLMIFVDGIGIGKPDNESNTFYKRPFRFLNEHFGATPSLENQFIEKDGKYIFPVDACMGVDGLPLSGTGQTSIFCGINASQILGEHSGPSPHSSQVKYLEEQSIFKDFLNKKKKVTFVNAYPKQFFDYINSGRKRLSATTLSCLLNGVRLNKISDLRKGNALSADIDNSRLVRRMGYKLPIIKPKTAAKRLLKITSENHFTLFEYFMTDHFGHGRVADEKDYLLNVFDEFLFHVIDLLDNKMTFILCSDHGNLEDISTKSHTRNPALTITAGKNAKKLRDKIKYLYDIKPAIMEMYP
ncbi:MAG: metalloenzyme [bacterium]